MASSFLSALQPKPHLHLAGDQCPYCDQPIPNDRLDEIRQRIAAKDRQRALEAEAKAKADVEAVKAQAAIQLEAALTEAEAAHGQLEKTKADAAAVVEKLSAEFSSKEAAIRAEAGRAAETAFATKLKDVSDAKDAAEKTAAEMRAAHEQALAVRVLEVREAYEKAKADAVNAEQAKNAAERAKFESIVDDLKRKVESKSVEDLGEGAEVDLFEALKAEFPGDLITRVGRGNAGADVIHEVRHNGAKCGIIVYDSKNHLQWRADHATKLREDKIAANADHAVLSTRAFPKDRKQLHIEHGVVVANPARAVVIAMLLRQQIVQLHCLKVSNEQRASKTEELYALMTSERFTQFLSAVMTGAEQLEDMQVKEKKAHEAVWKKQGELFRTIIRTCGQFDQEIARIVGTWT